MHSKLDNNIELCWGTPVSVFEITESSVINPNIEKYIKNRYEDFNLISSKGSVFNSLSNLDNWDIEESRVLKNLIIKKFLFFLKNIQIQFPSTTPISLLCSFAGYGNNKISLQEKKRKSAWTAIYLINCGLDGNMKDKNNIISFLDPRNGSGMVSDGFDVFGNSRDFNFKVGQLFFFPSWISLGHKSNLYNKNNFYITIEIIFPDLV